MRLRMFPIMTHRHDGLPWYGLPGGEGSSRERALRGMAGFGRSIDHGGKIGRRCTPGRNKEAVLAQRGLVDGRKRGRLVSGPAHAPADSWSPLVEGNQRKERSVLRLPRPDQ